MANWVQKRCPVDDLREAEAEEAHWSGDEALETARNPGFLGIDIGISMVSHMKMDMNGIIYG